MCTYISAMVMVTSLFSNRRWNSPLWCGMVYMAKCQNSTRENSSIRSIRTKAYGLATQTTPMCLVFMTPKFKLWIDFILQCVAMFRNNNIQWMEEKTSTLPYSPSLIECACFRPKLWFISVIQSCVHVGTEHPIHEKELTCLRLKAPSPNTAGDEKASTEILFESSEPSSILHFTSNCLSFPNSISSLVCSHGNNRNYIDRHNNKWLDILISGYNLGQCGGGRGNWSNHLPEEGFCIFRTIPWNASSSKMLHTITW